MNLIQWHLTDDSEDQHEENEPNIDPVTNEWILTPYDLDCIALGSTVVGSGGGGRIDIGKLRVQMAMANNQKVKVINPEQ